MSNENRYEDINEITKSAKTHRDLLRSGQK